MDSDQTACEPCTDLARQLYEIRCVLDGVGIAAFDTNGALVPTVDMVRAAASQILVMYAQERARKVRAKLLKLGEG